MTERQAENTLMSLQDEITNKLCPVFQARCKGKDCNSFHPGEYQGTERHWYIVSKPTCTCAFVTGYIDHAE